MSSDSLVTLEYLQVNNYLALTVVAAVVYDYLLTLSGEIEFIWFRPWTRVSTIFVLVRYVGLSWAIWHILHSWVIKSTLVVLIKAWSYPVFLAAADFVMILRVYALWNRSRKILSVLLFLWVSEIVVSFVFLGIYSNPDTYLTVTVAQVFDFLYCYDNWHDTPSHLIFYADIPRFTLGAALLVLAVVQSITQSARMYKATKVWQLNRYIRQFTKDGILYFLANELYNVSATVFQSYSFTSDTWMLFLNMVIYVAICPMMPRFILDVRELYDRDLQGVYGDRRRGHPTVGRNSRHEGIDTGFGMSLRPVPTSEDVVLSSISFADFSAIDADSVPGEDSFAESEGAPGRIPMQVLGDNDTHRV